jgi:polyphosphate kinase
VIDIPFRSKEVSWLSFNSRVLQEARLPGTPLLERVKFLGIYSSNLDEFFRIRIATLRRLARLGLPPEKLGIPDPSETLQRVNQTLKAESRLFNEVYEQVFQSLREERIRVITDKEVPPALEEHLRGYFSREVLPRLMPIVIKSTSVLRDLQDQPMYLAVKLGRRVGSGRPLHALIEIPTDIPRFHVLPKIGEEQLVMYLDDVIRFGLPMVFEPTHYDSFEAYAVKFTRDAEMEFDNDFMDSLYEQLSEGLKAREEGDPVRINYDANMPKPFLRLVMHALDVVGDEDSKFPGARYHNRKDLMKFPTLGRGDLQYPPLQPVLPPRVDAEDNNLFRSIRARDILLHIPYHSFHHFLDLLRQASIDPLVKTIRMTQYRLAKDSFVARALINAVRNGKEVTVLVEPTARFDEQNNMTWASRYRDAGIRVIWGVPGLKVHAKLCLIERIELGILRSYSVVGSGNFNEATAKVYTDHMLFTANPEIGEDLLQIFRFFDRNYETPKLRHLVCAPFTLRSTIYEAIDREIAAAQAGETARIWIKINNLSDVEVVRRLYRAAAAGVDIRLIVRGMFSLDTGEPDCAHHLAAIGIVDQLLEHARILIFHNRGKRRFYLSSADFLPRNFDSRCEVLCPILDPWLQEQLARYVEIQWSDTVKARVLDSSLSNQLREPSGSAPPIRAQAAIREYLSKLDSLDPQGS